MRDSSFEPGLVRNMPNSEDRWLSTQEISAHLGMNTDTIYRWIRKKGMPAHKVGGLWKFQREEVDDWAKSGDVNDHMGNNDNHLYNSITLMAIESWRFGKVFDRALNRLDVGEQNRYKSQFRWFIKKVEEALAQAEMRIVNIEGQTFDPGMAATPLNIEEFEPDDELIVDQMLEPIIMSEEGLVKTGVITLKKVEL